MKLLHLIKDDKFPDAAFEVFESVAPGQSTYMLAGKSAPIRFLKKVKPVRVFKYAFLSKKFIKSLESYDVIILHSLYPFALEVLARIEFKVSIVWIGMGYDYYDLLSGGAANLLKHETKMIYRPSTQRLRKSPVKIIESVARRLLHPNMFRKKSLIKKIDLFAPVLESEYLLLKRTVGDPFPQFIRWNYGKIIDLVDGRLSSKHVNGKNILVGNSATHTNNHLDAFQILSRIGIPDDSCVVVPLSYGDPAYKKAIIDKGKRLFGTQFKPITEFLSIEDYIDLLSSCSSVIMNHLRQQGAGNLFIALYLGARVYLDTENPLYEEFKRMGLQVNSLEDLSDEREELSKPLEQEVVTRHKEILKAARGQEAFNRYTENLIAEASRINSEKAS